MPGEASSSLGWLLGIEDSAQDAGAVAGAVVGVGVGIGVGVEIGAWVATARAREAGGRLAEEGH